MRSITEELSHLMQECSQNKEKCINGLEGLPEGKVMRTRCHGKNVSYRLTRKDDKLCRRMISDRAELAGLLRREYLNLCADSFEKQKDALNQSRQTLRKIKDEQQILKDLLAKRCPDADEELIRMIVSPGSDPWADAPYKQFSYKPENRRFPTGRGILLRSKSELLIAELLDAYGIPFRYEETVEFEGMTLAPDFTIRKRDGSLIYWEHMGLITNIRYYDSQLSKLRMYYAAGIVPWDNLIISFDNDRGIISAADIRNKIETRILTV